MTAQTAASAQQPHRVRRATTADAETVAQLLHDFNTEFDTESPGVAELTERLRALLASDSTLAFLGGAEDGPDDAVALVTLRTNVWYSGLVALLDEMYVVPARRGEGIGGAVIRRLIADAAAEGWSAIEINVDAPDVDAQRFYEREGFHGVQPDTGDRAYYYFLEL